MQTILTPQFSAIIFDMDNTLFDFYVCLKAGCAAAVASIGAGTADELYRCFFSGRNHIEDPLNIQEFMQAHECFSIEGYLAAVAAFDEARMRVLKPYDGIPEVLAALKANGYRLGLVTDAYMYAAEQRLEKTGLLKYFDVRVAFDTTGYKKPHHEPFLCALDLLSVKPFETMFIGDSLVRDVYPAAAVGMTAVHASYGDIYGGDECGHPSVDTPADILTLLHAA